MKLTSKIIVFLFVCGLAMLVAMGLYFGSPLFGQVILGLIIAIFSVSQFRYYKALGHLEAEEALLPEYRAQARPEPLGDGVIAKRIRVAADLASRRVFPDPQVFSETLSATESALVARSPSGLVVMLGLMGTFYGLMVAVSTAGNTLSHGGNAASTLSSVQLIFNSMQGIFGTSLAGLVAALVLNATHAMLNGMQNRLLADIEEYTQFQLLPAFAPSNDPAERQMELMVEKLGQVTLALQQGLQERNEQSLQMLRAQVESSTAALREGLQGELRALNADMAKLTSSYAKSLADSANQTSAGLEKALASFQEDFGSRQRMAEESLRGTVQSVADQMLATQTKSASAMQEAVQSLSGSLVAQQGVAVEGLRASVQELTLELSALQKLTADNLQENVLKLSSELGSLQQAAADGLRASVGAVAEELSSGARSQVEGYQRQWAAMAEQGTAQLEASRAQWADFMDSLKESSAESLVHQKEGLSTLRDVAEQVAVKALDESANLSSTFAAQIEKLSAEVQSSFGQLAGASRELVEAQGRLLSEMENRIVQEKEATAGFSGDLAEAATLMRVNQSEFQATLEMFNMGVEHILEKFTGNSAEQESQRNFIEQLHASLEAFHEKASEVLVENAMRTQEILLEILDRGAEGKAEA